MTVRKKVVPPVTPKIVQARPRQRLFRYVFLLCAFVLTAWFSYDYGRTRAPVNVSAETPVAQSHESEQRITELEQERDALKQQVAELEDSVQQVNRALVETRARMPAPQQAESPPHEIPAPLTEPDPEPATTESEPVDNTLKLANVRIVPTDSADVFRIGFSVMHYGDASDRVTGTIWIAVNGFSAGKPRRLSFKTLSPDARLYVKMGFDQQQDVLEDVVLPADFRPKNILIEAKPYGEKYTGTSMKLAWDTNG
jgi:cell division protein FtsB